MIHLKDCDIKSPDGKLLLKRLSFDLATGYRLAFYGPDGCGKSTLLRYLAGLEADHRVYHTPSLCHHLSYIPTRPLDLLLPWLSVLKNTRLFDFLAKRKAVDQRWSSPLDFGRALGCDLAQFKDNPVYTLSSGRQAILAIYCAVIQNNPILIADEIFATLSEPLRRVAADYLKDLETTIICASHDSAFIARLGATVVHLEPYIPMNRA